MSVAGITSATQAQTSGSERSERKSNDQMDKFDFLQLLVTQLRYQDPLKPMDDRDFAAQLAQFSALEQVAEQTKWTQMTYGLGLVGQKVTYTDDEGAVKTGVATALRMVDGKPMLVLGSVEIELSQVTEATRS